MEEILHQLIGRLSHYLQGFIHPRWWIFQYITWPAERQQFRKLMEPVALQEWEAWAQTWNQIKLSCFWTIHGNDFEKYLRISPSVLPYYIFFLLPYCSIGRNSMIPPITSRMPIMAANSNLWPPEIQNLEMHLGIAKGLTTHPRVMHAAWACLILHGCAMFCKT